jgi:hypothetical protein
MKQLAQPGCGLGQSLAWHGRVGRISSRCLDSSADAFRDSKGEMPAAAAAKYEAVHKVSGGPYT